MNPDHALATGWGPIPPVGVFTPPAETNSPQALADALNGKPMIKLPGGGVQIIEAATQIFTLAAKTDIYYRRGRKPVYIGKHPDGALEIIQLEPSAFRSKAEALATLAKIGTNNHGGYILKPNAVMSEDTARAILDCEDAVEVLPPINGISACPLIMENDNGGLVIAGKGYNKQSGILVTRGGTPEIVPLPDAILTFEKLLSGWKFETPSNYSRAIASFLTPALKMGGLLRGQVPPNIAEANMPQSGKGLLQKTVASFYGEKVQLIPQKTGGVGSLDESFMERLIAGRPFIQFDNLRGKLDSKVLESFFSADTFNCRVVGIRDVPVDPNRFFVFITSNGVDLTRDMSERACITRMVHQGKSKKFTDWPYTIAQQLDYYQGCIFAVVKAWHAAGKPHTNENRHSFKEWAEVLDWIVQNLFKAAPLLDGHEALQNNVASPALVFLRQLGHIVIKTERGGQDLAAHQLVEIAENETLEIPGAGRNQSEDDAARTIGKKFGPLFKESEIIDLGSLRVERVKKLSPEYRESNFYRFSANAANAL